MVGDGVSKKAIEPRVDAGGIGDRGAPSGSMSEGALDDVFGVGLRADASPCERYEMRPLPREDVE
jgi:hypothetical protein